MRRGSPDFHGRILPKTGSPRVPHRPSTAANVTMSAQVQRRCVRLAETAAGGSSTARNPHFSRRPPGVVGMTRRCVTEYDFDKAAVANVGNTGGHRIPGSVNDAPGHSKSGNTSKPGCSHCGPVNLSTRTEVNHRALGLRPTGPDGRMKALCFDHLEIGVGKGGGGQEGDAGPGGGGTLSAEAALCKAQHNMAARGTGKLTNFTSIPLSIIKSSAAKDYNETNPQMRLLKKGQVDDVEVFEALRSVKESVDKKYSEAARRRQRAQPSAFTPAANDMRWQMDVQKEARLQMSLMMSRFKVTHPNKGQMASLITDTVIQNMSLPISNETRHRQHLKVTVFYAIKEFTFGKTIEQTIQEDGASLPGPTRKLFSQLVHIRNRWDRQHVDFASTVKEEEEAKQKQFQPEDQGFPDAFQASHDGQHLVRLHLKGLKTWRPCDLLMDVVPVDPDGPFLLCPRMFYTIDSFEKGGVAKLVPTVPEAEGGESELSGGDSSDGDSDDSESDEAAAALRRRIPVVVHMCNPYRNSAHDKSTDSLRAEPPRIQIPKRGKHSQQRGSPGSATSGHGSVSFRAGLAARSSR